LTGEVRLDIEGDRIGNYRVWHLQVDGDEYEPLLDVMDGVEQHYSVRRRGFRCTVGPYASSQQTLTDHNQRYVIRL